MEDNQQHHVVMANMEMQPGDMPFEHTLSPAEEWMLCATVDSGVGALSSDTEDHREGDIGDAGLQDDSEDSWSLSDERGQEGVQPKQYHQDRSPKILAMRYLLDFGLLKDQVKKNEALLLDMMVRFKRLMLTNGTDDSTLTRMFSMEMQPRDTPTEPTASPQSIEKSEQWCSCMTADSQVGAPSSDTEDRIEGQAAEAVILEQVLLEDTEDTRSLQDESGTADIKELPEEQGQEDECEHIEVKSFSDQTNFVITMFRFFDEFELLKTQVNLLKKYNALQNKQMEKIQREVNALQLQVYLQKISETNL